MKNQNQEPKASDECCQLDEINRKLDEYNKALQIVNDGVKRGHSRDQVESAVRKAYPETLNDETGPAGWIK